MADIATLGIRVDTSGVDRARDSLNTFRGAASGASAGAKDFGGASEQMHRQLQTLSQQQDRTNQLLQQTNQTLQSGTISTHGYVDSMAKLATVVAAADLAYHGFSSAIDLAGRGMKEQVSVVSQLATGLQDLMKYGTNAFQLMNDQALNLQKSLIAIGNAVGTSGSAFSAFSTTLSRAGATGQQIAGAFPAVQGAATGVTVEDQRRRENLARMGVSTQGSTTDIAAAAVAALRQMNAGPERNALANQTLGPGGADMVNQAMGAIIKVTDLQRQYQELAEANARADIARAQARQEADEKNVQWYEAHPVSALLMSMVPGSAAGGVTAMRMGAMGRALMGTANEAMGQQAGLGVLTDLKASLGMLFGGAGPGFGEYGKLGKEGAAPPVTAEGQRAGYAAMAGVGFGDQAALQQLTDTWENLNAHAKDWGLTTDQLNAAFASLALKVQEIGDPIGTMLIGMKKQAELFQLPAGPMRQTQEALIQAGTPGYEKIHGAGSTAMASAQDIIGSMAPEQQAAVRGGAGAVSAAQQLDTLRALQQTTATMRAQAGAAGGGERATAAAAISAEAAYRSMQGFSGAADDAREKLTQLSLRFEEAGNALIGRGHGAVAEMAARGANLPVGGVVPAAGLVSQAGFSAAQTMGMAPGTNLGAAAPQTAATTLTGASQLMQRGTDLVAMMQTRGELIAQHADQPGSTGALRAQTGIVRFEHEIDSSVKAIEIEAAARGGMTKDMQTAIDALKGMGKAASDAAEKLIEEMKARATTRAITEQEKKVAELQQELRMQQSGASPEQMMASKIYTGAVEGIKAQGGTPTAAQLATLQQAATEQAALTSQIQDTIAAQKQWTDTLKGVIDDLGKGLEDVVFNSKNAKESLKSMMMDISKKGFGYFVEDPLKTAASNLLGIGDQGKGGGLGGIFGNAGQGFQSWIGKMTGGALGSTGGDTGGLLGKLDATAFGGAAGVTPVYVTNAGGMGGGGVGGIAGGSSVIPNTAGGGTDQNGFLSNIFGGQSSMLGRLFSNAPSVGDQGGPGGLGPEGGIGPNPGSAPNGGGFMSGGFMSTIGNAAKAGFNFLASGFNAATGNLFGGSVDLSNAGSLSDLMSEGGMASNDLGGAMAGGGMVGRDGTPRVINPAWFIGAPRYAMGGMIGPGEVPIIAHRGEMVLNRQQQAAINKGGNTTHVHMNVTAGNLDGFRSSAPQLAMAMMGHVDRASRRYG